MSGNIIAEILQVESSFFSTEAIIILAERFLRSLGNVAVGKIYKILENYKDFKELGQELQSHVEAITIEDTKFEKKVVSINDVRIKYQVYRLEFKGFRVDNIEKSNDLFNTEEVSIANNWMLPSRDFFGLWESLVYEEDIKKHMIRFAETTIMYANNKVDSNLISLNRVILLHGQPGTGKTSLCRALAQKLSIRLSQKFDKTYLIEINSQNLFSKWFSESGKLVGKLFDNLNTLAKNSNVLVCVLIDEVETLAHARSAAFSGTDPSDAIRVVNALLTQLDLIKHYENVFIMTTTNITGTVDMAFMDRADLHQYIGPPSVNAIYQIYLSAIEELTAREIIYPYEESFPYTVDDDFLSIGDSSLGMKLFQAAQNSVGFSGRKLRKIPLIAQALYLDSIPVNINDFLVAMNQAIERSKNSVV